MAKSTFGYAILVVAGNFLLISCSQPKTMAFDVDTSAIPDMAVEVIIHSELNPDDYYAFTRKTLQMMDIKILRNAAGDRVLRTHPVPIGRGLWLTIIVETYYDATYLTTVSKFSGRIHDMRINDYTGTDVRVAYWNSENDKSAHAFGQLVGIASKIEHSTMTFAISR